MSNNMKFGLFLNLCKWRLTECTLPRCWEHCGLAAQEFTRLLHGDPPVVLLKGMGGSPSLGNAHALPHTHSPPWREHMYMSPVGYTQRLPEDTAPVLVSPSAEALALAIPESCLSPLLNDSHLCVPPSDPTHHSLSLKHSLFGFKASLVVDASYLPLAAEVPG